MSKKIRPLKKKKKTATQFIFNRSCVVVAFFPIFKTAKRQKVRIWKTALKGSEVERQTLNG